MKREKSIKIMKFYIFPIILFFYPLIHYNVGVDVTDTGYSFGSFLFSAQMGEEWVSFAFYLSNMVGTFLTKLPYGRTMLGINLYTGLSVSAAALCSYFFFIRKIPAWIAFAGEFLAISLCWCPTVILYNYLTFLLFTIAVICLYIGLSKERWLFLFLAGAAIGVNMLVKFPNITETSLILSLWYYGALRRKKLGRIAWETGICMGGFLAGAGLIFLKIIIDGDMGNYFAMIGSLFGMGSGDVEGHALSDTLLSIVDAYFVAGKWLLYWIAYGAAGVLGFSFLSRLSVWKGVFRKIIQGLYGLGGILLVRLLYGRGMFNFRYYAYESMLQWASIFLIISLAVCLFVMFKRGIAQEDKLLMSLVFLLILTTPLGSDNYLYLNFNNLFLAAPAVFYWLWRFLREKGDFAVSRFQGSVYPVKAVLVLVLAVTMVQCTGFGFMFVFRDGVNGEKRDTRIESNSVLKGMYTYRENAEAIEEITAYCEKSGLSGRKVVLYGYIPAMSSFLDMPAALSTSWADLNSYSAASMERDIRRIVEDENLGERPVVLVSAEMGAWLSEDGEEMGYLGVTADKFEGDEKARLVRGLIGELQYQEVFANHKFVIYE